MSKGAKETIVSGIKVTIHGEISDYNIKLYNERLAIILMKELGPEVCEKLLELLNSKDSKKRKVS